MNELETNLRLLQEINEFNDIMKFKKKLTAEEIFEVLKEEGINLNEQEILEVYDKYISVFKTSDYFYQRDIKLWKVLDDKKQKVNSDLLLELIFKLTKKKRKKLKDKDPWYIVNALESIECLASVRVQLKKFLPCLERMTEAGKRINEKDIFELMGMDVLEWFTNVLSQYVYERPSEAEVRKVENVINDVFDFFEVEDDTVFYIKRILLTCYALQGNTKLVEQRKNDLLNAYPQCKMGTMTAIAEGLSFNRKEKELEQLYQTIITMPLESEEDKGNLKKLVDIYESYMKMD